MVLVLLKFTGLRQEGCDAVGAAFETLKEIEKRRLKKLEIEKVTGIFKRGKCEIEILCHYNSSVDSFLELLYEYAYRNWPHKYRQKHEAQLEPVGFFKFSASLNRHVKKVVQHQ